jgi:hypothetical protein
MCMSMKSISRFVVIFSILSVIFFYIIVNYFNSSQVGFANQIVWTDGLSNNRKEHAVVSVFQSNEELLSLQNYGELGSRLHMYKSTMYER